MAPWQVPEMSPWRRRPLTIPPNSLRTWVRLTVWQFWMGMLVCSAIGLGVKVIVTAPRSVVVVRDLTTCSSQSVVVQACEPAAYGFGTLNAAFSVVFGVQLVAVAAWLLWELWSAVEPKPITDDFLQLLNDSFARDWRNPRTWPWPRILWAYGFTVPGAVSALLIWTLVSASVPAKAPRPHVDTFQRFRLAR